jgi:ribosomal protein S18 acetylase RimI-like enzyme
MIASDAQMADVPAFLELAGQVERWFGPMVNEPAFHEALERSIDRGTALCVRRQDGDGLRGGILFSVRPQLCRINWLVVSHSDRRQGVGEALVTEAVRRQGGHGVVEVVTFSVDHPAAQPSGARAFYERLGFKAEEPADAGPDGTPRQWYRKR